MPPGDSVFCDTHAHVFGPQRRYPYNPGRAYTPPDAPLEAWFALHAKLGIGRGVLVQPSVYGTDNRAILDAVAHHPAFRAFLARLEGGRWWVKLSAPYRITARSALPFDDVAPFARTLAAARPDRLLWGSDWPRPYIRSKAVAPDDEGMFAQLAQWIPDAALRRPILADNPANLYGF